MKLVLFDCDGTLVDSIANIHACMEKTFVEAGYPAPHLSETKSIIGLTLDQAIARMLGKWVDGQVADMTIRYRHHSQTLRSQPTFDEPFFDGIRGVVDTLAVHDDILLGLVTGKSRRGLNHLIEKHGLEASFVSSRTADECPSKPHPAMVLECCAETGIDPSRTVVVGDAVYDMQMARAAGARAIGVSWGYATTGQLIESGAHHVIHQPGSLFPLLIDGEAKEAAVAGHLQ